MRRRLLLLGGLVALVAAVAGLTLPAGGQDADTDDDGGDREPSTTTAPVERRDLVERESLDGTLGYGEARDLAFGGQGTITALAAAGTIVERGGTLGEVDGRPVPLLYGDRPMWRTIGEGADTTDGADIAQLEANLIALGYATESALGPNETWSAATTAALKRWQRDLGVDQTGRLDLGSVVYSPAAVRIADHIAEPGAMAGGAALKVTGTERTVDVDLPASRQGLVEPGQAVEVELPDGTVVPATVQTVSSVVEPGDQSMGSTPTVPVVITLDDPAGAGALDEAPVDVDVVSVQASDALAVPVEALLALAEGGYAVQRPDGSLVGVETGAFADGYVEIRPTGGELTEGDDVVVPS